MKYPTCLSILILRTLSTDLAFDPTHIIFPDKSNRTLTTLTTLTNCAWTIAHLPTDDGVITTA